MENNSNEKKKRGIKVYIPLFLVIAIILVLGIIWYRQYSKYIRTDDAYIDTDKIAVSSKTMGRIVKLYADEGDSVRKGELLAQLDTVDILAKKDGAIAAKNFAQTKLLEAEAQYQYSQEKIKTLEILNDKAKSDYDRAKKQFDGGVIPEEKYDDLKKAYEISDANLAAEKTKLKMAQTQVESGKAAIETAIAAVKIVETNLDNTRLYSPITGLVAKRWLLPGDIASPGQSVFTVTDNHKLWVLLNLEETKIAGVHLNQQSFFTVDAFSGVTFTGKVFYIGTNTASQFSLIPPNNASGNFTKVTQRIPVKISIDGTEDGGKPGKYDLRAGMSVVVKILKD